MNVQQVVTKAEFARILGVGRSAVAHHLPKLSREAKPFVNGKEMIDVARAKAELNQTTDMVQRSVNGQMDLSPAGPTDGAAPAPAPVLPIGGVDAEYKAERLRKIQRENAEGDLALAERAGTLTPADRARTAFARAMGDVLQAFDAAIPDWAARIAGAVPGADVRTVTLELRAGLRETRARLAKVQAARADGLPQLFEVEIAGQGADDDHPMPAAAE